ncbi:MAG: ATP-dependent DNA helicase DinG [Pseudomonadales bacterium]
MSDIAADLPLLTDALKEEIQRAYRGWLDSRGFRPRRGQREMIAAVARTVVGAAPRLLVVEAGTGTGKTAGYCLPVIPLARALGKRAVISTATVALQEQVVLRDLPDLAERSGLRFSWALAKGRGRYVCLKRLDDRLRGETQSGLPFAESFSGAGAAADLPVWQAMLDAFGQRAWNGELDTWDAGVSDTAWQGVTTDHRGCANNRCSFFRQCPFFKARAELDGVDVVVANHDLVLADLALGGGAVLPEPEDTIFVFDEAHHLPDKTRQHFGANTRLLATAAWLDAVATTLGSLAQRFGRPNALVDLATRVGADVAAAQAAVRERYECAEALEFAPRDEGLETCRFALGSVPESIAVQSAVAAGPIRALESSIERAHGLMQDVLAGDLSWPGGFEAEDWLPVLGQQLSRAGAVRALLDDYAGNTETSGIQARWVNRYATDLELVAAPIEPGLLLHSHLWSRCHAAIATSATLTAAGRFERFLEQSGIPDANTLRIASPFDYPNIATLTVPRMRTDPGDGAAHAEEVAMLLPGLLAEAPGALVLFTSWRQLRDVVRRLPAPLTARMKIQGDASKQALLTAHRDAVDAGEQSVLVGLASFAEGVDLPDDYCRHVVIAKLPFAVPDDPVDQAMAEWAEAQGRNPFFEISVPDAALRLVQACGRLIRHERDYGRITLLDRRVITRRYGQRLLDSLPPFRRELDFVL